MKRMKIIVAYTYIPFERNAGQEKAEKLAGKICEKGHKVQVMPMTIAMNSKTLLSEILGIRRRQIEKYCDMLIVMDRWSALLKHRKKMAVFDKINDAERVEEVGNDAYCRKVNVVADNAVKIGLKEARKIYSLDEFLMESFLDEDSDCK